MGLLMKRSFNFMITFKKISILSKPSIARRVFITMAIATLTVWISIYFLGLYHVLLSEDCSLDSDMKALSRSLSLAIDSQADTSLVPIALLGVQATLDSQAIQNKHPIHVTSFRVLTNSGKIIAQSRDLKIHIEKKGNELGFFDSIVNGTSYRFYATQTQNEQFRVEVFEPIDTRLSEFNNVMFSFDWFALPLLIGLPILFIPIWLAVYSGMRPLRQLTSELASRKFGDLKQINIPHIYSEFTPFVKELNNIFDSERAFLADAAHELRTPIALISIQTDTLIKAKHQLDRDTAGKLLNNGIARASRLVNQLLALARLESNDNEGVSNIDVSEFIRDCLANHSIAASRENKELFFVAPDSFIFTLNSDALHSVVNNLVSNAIKYIDSGGNIIIELSPQNNHQFQLQIKDDGPGIPLQEREFIFQRFYRGSAAKNTKTGAGLGLSIVASALQKLNAQIKIHDGISGNGIGFTVFFDERIDK
nr:ATP-binding protein [uncultured Undibacterium sp.]